MKRRNVLTLVLALVLVAALAVGGTLAYFTDSDDASNTFTMGKVDINLQESNGPDAEGNETWVEDGLSYTEVLPGDTQVKKARVTVAGDSADCYVMVNVALTTPEGSKLTGQNIADLYTAIQNEISTDVWTVTVNDDGTLQCVYKEVAHPGDILSLFNQITIPGESFKNNTANQSFSIVLNAYAIQSENVGAVDTVDWTQSFEVYEPAA